VGFQADAAAEVDGEDAEEADASAVDELGEEGADGDAGGVGGAQHIGDGDGGEGVWAVADAAWVGAAEAVAVVVASEAVLVPSAS
jgi:hypothetical protein